MLNVSANNTGHSSTMKWVAACALIGCLGYYVIRWIINKCLKTAAVDEAAKEVFHSLLKKSPRNSCETLEISPEKIKMGYGEYVVFRDEGEAELSKDTYEKVYDIFDKYSPASIVNTAAKDPTISAEEQCANRYELIRGKVKELDPNLDIAFVPRTLYELILLRKCIQEDVKATEICSYLDTFTQILVHYPEKSWVDAEKKAELIEKIQAGQLKKKCWHLCYFDDAGNNQNQSVKDVAYRLNRAIVKTLSPEAGGLTYAQLFQQTEKEIDFLKKHYAEQKEEPSSCSIHNPTTNFKTESRRGGIRPMGIRHDQDAQIIKNAVAVECSKIAERSFLISRGANFEKDAPHSWKNPDRPFSTSWSTGLFSGCVYNGEDASYYYMRNGSDGYIIPVPFDRLNNSPFYIPTTNVIVQLFGTGEIFHARSKAWKETDIATKGLPGIQMGEQRIEHLKSDLTKDELITQYQTFKDSAIQLK